MAEAVISFAVEKLTEFIISEAELLGNLSGDVKALGDELATIKVVLKDAEKKAEQDDSINEWLRQVREIGYHIEDVIEEYVLLKESRKQQQQQSLHNTSQRHNFFLMITKIRKWLGKAVACVSDIIPKHELASTIKEIKSGLLEISNRRERYNFITTTDNSNEHSNNEQNHHVYSLFMDDSELYGIEDHKSEIVELLNLKLQHDHAAECALSVVPVVGMGGIGKTTLVRKVFQDKEVRDCFLVHAWVPVSLSYQRRDLLENIYKQVDAPSSLKITESDEVFIIDELRKHLQGLRYIVVFDDVWDSELCKFVKAVLPANDHGSRILMTTRDKNIARHWMASLGCHRAYDLKPLSEEVASDFFCQKTFGKGNCPPELEELSQNMVKKCDGLPLAIVAVAGLLSTKDNSLSEWNKVYNSLGFELGNSRHFTSVTNILLLSYHELPFYLKPCFLYFGMLPKAFFIGRMRLIRLWIAEGFIQKHQGKTLEEVAEEYLNELVNRNLVQVYVEGYGQKGSTFRVHDILREMIILPKLDNLCFCQVLSQDSFPKTKHFRRVSIHTDFFQDNINGTNVSEVLISDPSIRSLLWFVRPLILPDLPVIPFLKVARFLKVMDLEDSPIDHIPEELGNLHHLRYLSLRNTKIEVLPRSIGKLQNLQTLNLKHCYVVELPKEIGQCHKLRHLLTFRVIEESKQAVKVHDGVLENFKELQKLALVEADRASLIQELQQLRQLRTLSITMVKKEHGRALCSALEEMKHLRSLSIHSADNEEIIDLQHIARSPPLLLKNLYLKGRLEKFPDWLKNLRNLAILHLQSSRLEDDPAESIQMLPNLVELTLNDAYVGEKLDFGFTEFSKMEWLVIYNMFNLKSIVNVTLPALQGADVESCPRLEDKPHTITDMLIRKERYRTAVLVSKAALQFIHGLNLKEL